MVQIVIEMDEECGGADRHCGVWFWSAGGSVRDRAIRAREVMLWSPPPTVRFIAAPSCK